jgi:hypothetical protein
MRGFILNHSDRTAAINKDANTMARRLRRLMQKRIRTERATAAQPAWRFFNSSVISA